MVLKVYKKITTTGKISKTFFYSSFSWKHKFTIHDCFICQYHIWL